MENEYLEKIIQDNNIKLTKKAHFILNMVFATERNNTLDMITNKLILKRDNLPEFEDGGPTGKKSTAEKYAILDEIINLIQLNKK